VRVAWLLRDLALSGGGGIVVQHAARLSAEHGIEGTIVRCRPPTGPEWDYPGLSSLPVVDLADLRGDRPPGRPPFDLAIATWWETALDVFDLEADRYAYFLQLLEDSHYPIGSAERLGFQLTYGLPVRFITAARWITDVVERMQPGNPAFYVPSGIDKDVWSPPAEVPPGEGPLRVVIEGGLDLVRKGVPHALEAVRLMREPHHVTLVTPTAPGAAPVAGVDAHLGALSHAQLAGVFRDAHVLLKLSRAEGMYGPPLEAFHCGCTCVTNPVTGHEEYVVHDENALVVDWDDPVGTARALDLLARDRPTLARLREGALATARAWPSWEQSSAAMADALRTLVAEPPPDPRACGLRAAAGAEAVMAHAEIHARYEQKAADELAALRDQRVVQTALKARRRATPVLQKARGLKARLKR
jgi:O-antigen biosynthesis protein